MWMHCELEHADKLKLEVGPIPPSDHNKFSLLKREEQRWTRQMGVHLVNLPLNGQMARENVNLAYVRARLQWC